MIRFVVKFYIYAGDTTFKHQYDFDDYESAFKFYLKCLEAKVYKDIHIIKEKYTFVSCEVVK